MEKVIRHIKKVPGLLSVIMAFMIGFILASMIIQIGGDIPLPDKAKEYIGEFITNHPLAFLIPLALSVFVAVVVAISQVWFWIKGYRVIRRKWKRAKRREHFKRYGYSPSK